MRSATRFMEPSQSSHGGTMMVTHGSESVTRASELRRPTFHGYSSAFTEPIRLVRAQAEAQAWASRSSNTSSRHTADRCEPKAYWGEVRRSALRFHPQ